jgi:hypothetical protein
MSLFCQRKSSYTICMQPKRTEIKIGCHVELNLLDRVGKKDRLSIDIVPDASADFSHGFLGESTPIARVLLGEREGNVIPYLKDDIFAIEILSISPSTITPPVDAQELRRSKMNKALREVEHTNAVVFASSFSGKWGDYDPDSLPVDEISEENEPEEENP